jgi:tRNA pseudouridine38-40 synthase
VNVRTLKLTLAYDGSAYHGWQIQPGKPTIQGTLAAALHSLTGEAALPQGSGRTDAGVHALAQIASFQTASPIPVANFRVVLNDRLPPAIRVLAVDEMPADFHARHSARAKRYHYRIWRGDVVPPFLARYVTHHPYPLDEDAMQQAAAMVVGEHDFTSFAAFDPDRTLRLAQPTSDENLPTNIRTIYESRFERIVERNAERNSDRRADDRPADELIYIVRGTGFLHHMVRNLIGTFLLAGKGSITPAQIPAILAACDRRAAGPTAPPDGLYLVEVEY